MNYIMPMMDYAKEMFTHKNFLHKERDEVEKKLREDRTKNPKVSPRCRCDCRLTNAVHPLLHVGGPQSSRQIIIELFGLETHLQARIYLCQW